MGDITKDEYYALGLQDALEYDHITEYTCGTYQCEDVDKTVVVDSRNCNNSFVYANKVLEDGTTHPKFVPSYSMCPKCLMVMVQGREEFFKKKDEPKYRFSATKAEGDRGNNYYRDFSATKSVTTAEPGVGQDYTKVSKQDMANFEKNMNK